MLVVVCSVVVVTPNVGVGGVVAISVVVIDSVVAVVVSNSVVVLGPTWC